MSLKFSNVQYHPPSLQFRSAKRPGDSFQQDPQHEDPWHFSSFAQRRQERLEQQVRRYERVPDGSAALTGLEEDADGGDDLLAAMQRTRSGSAGRLSLREKRSVSFAVHVAIEPGAAKRSCL